MTSQVTAPPPSTSDVEPPAETEKQRTKPPPPSAAGPSTGVDPSLQQASTLPSDGSNVPADQIKKPSEVNRDDPNINVVELAPRSQTFKEQVYGYARLIRGTMLGRPEVKEQGTQVLRGEQGIPLRQGSQSSK